MASAIMIGREGPSRFTSWISGCQKRAFTLWYSSGEGPARCGRVAHEMPVLIPNCGLCVFMCASRQTVPNHAFCRGLTTILAPNHVHVPRRADIVGKWRPPNKSRTRSVVLERDRSFDSRLYSVTPNKDPTKDAFRRRHVPATLTVPAGEGASVATRAVCSSQI